MGVCDLTCLKVFSMMLGFVFVLASLVGVGSSIAPAGFSCFILGDVGIPSSVAHAHLLAGWGPDRLGGHLCCRELCHGFQSCHNWGPHPCLHALCVVPTQPGALAWAPSKSEWWITSGRKIKETVILPCKKAKMTNVWSLAVSI